MSETKKVLVTLPVTEEDKAYFERQAEGGSFRCLFTYLPGEEVTEEAAVSFDAIIGNIAPSLLHGGAKPEWMQLNSAGAESYAGTDVLGENAVLTNAAGVRLGDIQSIDYSWSESEITVQSIRALPMVAEGMAPERLSMDVEPDDVELSDTVTVIWEIGT